MVQAPSHPQPGARPVALVTGAARRIGRAITLHLATHGWDVVLHHRSSAAGAEATAADARALGARAWLVAADLADDTACNALVPAAVAQAGRLDAVVNNASLFSYDDVASYTGPVAEQHFRANTTPAVLLARALHAHLAARGAQGCVVNLLDQKLVNPNPDYFSYTLSKAALWTMTQTMAQSLAPRIRVNAIGPGPTLREKGQSEAAFQRSQATAPLGYAADAEDVTNALLYLLGAKSVTGQMIAVDGGKHLDFPATRGPTPRKAAR